MNDNNDIQQTSINSIDRPSFHWHKKYIEKAHKIAEKNITRNVDETSIYKKFPKIYKFSFLYFLPFYIGYLISFITIFRAYGKIKSSSIFNRNLYNYFKLRVMIIVLLYILFGPILGLILIIFFPMLCGVPFDVFVGSLNEIFSGQWNSILQNTIGEKLEEFSNFQKVIYYTFNNGKWIIGIIIIAAVSMANIPAIIGYFVINVINDKTISLYVLDDHLKMKISRFSNQKSKKIIRKKIINVHIPKDNMTQ